MEKCNSSIKKYSMTYEWVIENFSVRLELFDKCFEREITSPYFSPLPNWKNLFNLTLLLHSKSVQYYLSRHEDICKETIIDIELCILNYNTNTKYNVSSCTTWPIKHRIIGYKQSISMDDLLNDSLGLLSNDTLTIVCNVSLYVQKNNVKTISVKKPEKLAFSIENKLKEFYENQIGWDFKFDFFNREIKTNKLMLMMRSPVFKAMFENDMIEKQSNCTIITDIRSEIFELMIKFIYTNEIDSTLKEHDLMELLMTAEKYQIEDLEEICKEMILKMISVNNAMEILLLAEQYHNEKIEKHIKKFIDTHKEKVLRTITVDYFIKYPHHTVMFFKK